jgi:hypothetical protein
LIVLRPTFARLVLPSKQLHELFNGESGVGDDAAERAGSDLLVVGNNGPGVRLVAAQDHVAAGLTPEYEAGTLEDGTDVTPG